MLKRLVFLLSFFSSAIAFGAISDDVLLKPATSFNPEYVHSLSHSYDDSVVFSFAQEKIISSQSLNSIIGDLHRKHPQTQALNGNQLREFVLRLNLSLRFAKNGFSELSKNEFFYVTGLMGEITSALQGDDLIHQVMHTVLQDSIDELGGLRKSERQRLHDGLAEFHRLLLNPVFLKKAGLEQTDGFRDKNFSRGYWVAITLFIATTAVFITMVYHGLSHFYIGDTYVETIRPAINIAVFLEISNFVYRFLKSRDLRRPWKKGSMAQHRAACEEVIDALGVLSEAPPP